MRRACVSSSKRIMRSSWRVVLCFFCAAIGVGGVTRWVEGRTRDGDGERAPSGSPGSDSARRLRDCFGAAGAASEGGAAAVRFSTLKHGSHTCPGTWRWSGRLQRLNRFPHCSQAGCPSESVRGAAPGGASEEPAQQHAHDAGACSSISASVCFALLCDMTPSLLTWIRSGRRSRLWKSDQRRRGSSGSGLRTSSVGSAVLELHADVLVGLWRCVMRHGGGECEGQCLSAV